MISVDSFNKLWLNRKLNETNKVLHTYTGETIKPKGTVEVWVKHKDESVKLPLLVVEGSGPTLFGRDWLSHIIVDWQKVYQVRESKLKEVINKHHDVFNSTLGKLEGFKAKIHIENTATPKFHKPRPVAYSMKSKIETELDRLVSMGIIHPVQFSDWATPIVPVLKPDRTVRICCDFKVTLNPVSKLDRYPIPRIEDFVCYIRRRMNLLETRYEPCLYADRIRREFTTVRSNQYSQGIISLYKTPIWY